MRIDIHAHYFPAEYIDELGRLRPDLADLLGTSRRPGAGSDEAELEARFQAMDAASVDLQIISAASNMPYAEREADAVSLARHANDLFAAMVERYPTRFRAFAVLPLPHVDASLEELSRALDELGMVGVTVGASVRGGSICDPAFDPIYEEMNRRGTALFGHAEQRALSAPLLTEYPPVNMYIGAAFENTVFAMHLVRAQIPLRYPNLKAIVCHLGGTLPIQLQRIDSAARTFNRQGVRVDGADRFVGELPELPSATLRRFWYETTCMSDVIALRAAHDAFGVDRLLLGTDFPYSAAVYPEAIQFIQEAGLPKGHAEQIVDDNAASLLGLQ